MPAKGTTWINMKATREERDQIKTFNVIGLCHSSDDPDLWFSEEIEVLGRRGGPTNEQKEYNISRTIKALSICDKCPLISDCLTEGMKPENLDEGVWGGLMVGERLIKAGAPVKSHYRSNKILFAKKVRARYEQ
jgi:hypothetical protein